MPRSTVRWLEVSTEVTAEAVEAVAEVFQRDAHGGVVIEYPTEPGLDSTWNDPAVIDPSKPIIVRGYVPKTRDGARRRRKIEEALWHLNVIWPVPPPIVREVHEEDWANAWREHFVAHRVGRNLVIRPSWREFSAGPEDLVITLDPGMAFGTGLHPTTRLALAAIEDHVRAGDRVLDVGTGSGILSLAAARVGASVILACDIDEVAVDAAQSNVTANGFDSVITVRQGSVDIAANSERFDVVIANIIANVIIDLAPKLAASVRPGGTLIGSGILDIRIDPVRVALEPLGFVIEQVLEQSDWRAIVCRKQMTLSIVSVA